MNLFKSVLHNIGVIIVGVIFAFIGFKLDIFFGIHNFASLTPIGEPLFIIGIVCMVVGFIIRVSATYLFYRQGMDVIVLHPQKTFITSGPYSYSRNPLYLGGNIFIFFGAMFVFGTVSGIVLNMLSLLLVQYMIKREEGQLALEFGEKWQEYKGRVRRWI